mmetsp:Transcript_13532/g.18160  ORF Transcript_13532/g.18160 Transcript_13532/m.18160 type:complete len:111 (+) Transcript_13532:1448-1780(+)
MTSIAILFAVSVYLKKRIPYSNAPIIMTIVVNDGEGDVGYRRYPSSVAYDDSHNKCVYSRSTTSGVTAYQHQQDSPPQVYYDHLVACKDQSQWRALYSRLVSNWSLLASE